MDTLLVTESHLDTAIAEYEASGFKQAAKHCVLTVAVRDVFPENRISSHQDGFELWDHTQERFVAWYKFTDRKAALDIVYLFDTKKYEEVRKWLPAELEFEKQ